MCAYCVVVQLFPLVAMTTGLFQPEIDNNESRNEGGPGFRRQAVIANLYFSWSLLPAAGLLQILQSATGAASSWTTTQYAHMHYACRQINVFLWMR